MTAKVTVGNEIDTSSNGLLTLTIAPLDSDDPPVTLRQTPVSEKRMYSPQWTSRSPAGAVLNGADWTGNAPRTMSIEAVQSIETDDDPLALETMLGTIRRIVETPTDRTQQPSRVLVSIGQHSMTGYLHDLVITKRFMDNLGNARVADLSFQVTETF